MNKIMQANIMSCDRSPSYLEETIKNLKEFNIKVIYQSNKKIKLPENYIKTNKPFENDVFRNSQYNYAQVLKLADSPLIVEDDVKPSLYIEEHLKSLSHLLRSDTFIVALYSCYDWEYSSKLALVDYPIEQFYGTQAMYISQDVRKKLSIFISEHIGEKPYDMMIKDFCKINNVKLQATNFSLFQHTGVTSSGLGSFHECFNFVDNFL